MDRPPLDAVALRGALGTRWARIDIVDVVDSTNAALLADAAAPDHTVLAAEDQVAGRGRLDRSWQSPARAGLTVSVLLRPAAPFPTWSWLPLVTGLAVREAVEDVTGVTAQLKWPNDVLVHGRKLAGILAQAAGSAVVVGIGLNVSTTADELPVDTATSLALAGARSTDRTRLLVAMLRRLDVRAAQWDAVGGDATACGLADDYRRECDTIGRDVTVRLLDDSTVVGRAIDVDSAGRLLVDHDGSVEAIGAGDVEHVRPVQ